MFGVPVEGWSIEKILQHTEKNQTPVWMVTANPEILLEARGDAAYASALKQADIRTVDGMGLYLAGRLFGERWHRVTGVELGEAYLKKAAEIKSRVAFIGGKPGVAAAAAKKWQDLLPGLVVAHEEGGNVSRDGEDDERGEEARHRLTLFAPEILLVGFGHPKQERWIARYLADFPRVKIVIGVGGALDYWAGTVRRAPRLVRRLGLEWLWRLIRQPWRISRILRAVVVFPVLALFSVRRSDPS
jgi:bacterial polymer biosynthesis proteins, WecB/TagA/CpsF family